MTCFGVLRAVDGELWSGLSDEEVIARVRAGEVALYEVLMRRHNQQVYRAARSILRDEAEAEDVMQEAYVRAYEHLGQFAGHAKFSTWLTRIAVYEALARLRRRGRTTQLEPETETKAGTMPQGTARTRDPERETYDRELRVVLQNAIDGLPEIYRTVFVLRAVQGLSVAETAACLEVGDETVKTRLHRARAALRREIYRQTGMAAPDVFPFHLSRCDRVVSAVLRRIGPAQQ